MFQPTQRRISEKIKSTLDSDAGARHGLHRQGDRCYLADGSLWLSLDFIRNLERTANMGKDAAEIREEFHARLGQIARELARGTLSRRSSARHQVLGVGSRRRGAGRRDGPATDRDQRSGAGRRLARGGTGRMPGLRGAGPQGPRPTPRAHDHAGRRRLETTCRQLPPLSAGFFSLRIKRWALIIPASAHACSRRSFMPASTVFPISRRRAIWPNCPT